MFILSIFKNAFSKWALGLVEGIAKELPGDWDLDFDLDFDLEWLFAGGVRLFELALDMPFFEADLPLRGLLEDISIV